MDDNVKDKSAAVEDTQQAADLEILSKLLSKSKNEAMYELRRLQHQQRPVTEFYNKQQLEVFFSKRIPPPQLDTLPADSSGAGLVSDRTKQLESFASISQDFMPEGIRLEMRGLFEQKRVTETLQGPLRQEMDQVLQDGLERRQRRVQGRRNRSQGHRQRNDTGSRHRQNARQRGRHVRFNLPENGQYPIPRRDQSQILSNLLQSPTLNALSPGEREEIVSEVRGLVQRQLVTSALSGEFRGVLELNIQQQLNHSQQGFSGEDFIRSLQRRSPRSNGEADSAIVSYSGGDLRQEMRAMKSELDELKQMMKTSFELQLDIQRSIRQEVAAALSAFLAPQQGGVASNLQPCTLPTLTVPSGHASVVQTTNPTASVVESGNCVICSDSSIDSVMYRCGHMCTCISCGIDLKSKGMKCPVCRAPITDVIRAFSSML